MTATKASDIFNQNTLLEMMKDVQLQKEKFLLAPPGARGLLNTAAWLDVNVLENPNVPPGQYYLVDQTDRNWYQGKWDYRYEVELKRDELVKSNFKAQYMQDMAAFVNKNLDDKMLYSALGVNHKDIMSSTYMMPENACDACHGSGKYNGEECWHCLGEGDDPTK